MTDPTLDALASVYAGVAEAGRALAAGEPERAIGELRDALILGRDVLADLEYGLDPEPEPDPEPQRR